VHSADNARVQEAILHWLRRLARNRLLDVGAVVVVVLVAGKLAAVLPASARQNDFAHYYVSSQLLSEGRNPYTASLAPLYAQHGFEFQERVPRATNPPLLLWAFVPFAALPAGVAFWAWFAVEVASLVWILILTRRRLCDRLSARGWLFFTAAVVSSGVVYWHLRYSQVQLPLAALVLAAFGWQCSGKPVRACIAVALAGLIKLYPFALLPWFIWRGGRVWRERARLATVAGGVVALGLAIPGLSMWGDFVRYARPALAENVVNYSFNFTLPSFVINLGYSTHGFNPTSAAAHMWWGAGVVVGAFVLLGAYGWCAVRRAAPEVEFGLLSVAMLVGSLTAWGHYQVFLIFPMAVLVCEVMARPTRGRVAALVLLVALLTVQGTVNSLWLDRHLTAKILINYLPLYGELVLAACLLTGRSRRPEPRSSQ
jgi:hypothetical protein